MYRVDMGTMDYTEALALQQILARVRSKGLLDRDVILLVEHPAVFTMGRRGGRDNLNVSEAFLEKQGIRIVQVERGGDITYHGPGQLVAYPILNLVTSWFGVREYVDILEEVMIRTAKEFGVEAGRNPVNRGVWVDNRKLGSIGIAVQKSVSFHGLALNVNPSMEHFGWINPCGLHGICMTSLCNETGEIVNMNQVRRALSRYMADLFSVELVDAGILELRNRIAALTSLNQQREIHEINITDTQTTLVAKATIHRACQ